DADFCQKYSQNIKSKQYHSSVTWKVTVKDNIISSRTKNLFSETFYNKEGQPSKIIYFGENNRPKSFTIVKYNARKLPFEEVYFTADSVVTGGKIYEYDSDNLLKSQISYSGEIVTNTYQISRANDSIIVAETDSLNKVVSNGVISALTADQKEVVFRSVENTTENYAGYDILSEITHKHIVGTARKKSFIYEDGKVAKTSVFNSDNEEISSASLEYDAMGNISRIIERCEKDGSTNVYMINYR
ncbi:MAG: hypothetical protein HUK15_06170, partial [Bacteroidales bacterium]|nr:hypothetical protein [Bacteroidales bacterium]